MLREAISRVRKTTTSEHELTYSKTPISWYHLSSLNSVRSCSHYRLPRLLRPSPFLRIWSIWPQEQTHRGLSISPSKSSSRRCIHYGSPKVPIAFACWSSGTSPIAQASAAMGFSRMWTRSGWFPNSNAWSSSRKRRNRCKSSSSSSAGPRLSSVFRPLSRLLLHEEANVMSGGPTTVHSKSQKSTKPYHTVQMPQIKRNSFIASD